METENNTAAAIQAGKDAAGIGIRMWREGDFTLSMVPKDCDLKVLDNLLIMQENRAPTPRELAGKAVMRDEQSLILHAIRFRDEHSALFGTGSSYLAVYDYHRPVPRAGEANTLGRNTSARWRRHAAEFKPALSPEWTAWTTNAGKMFSQTEFAEWLEEHEQDLAGPMEGRSVPSPADLRTLCCRTETMGRQPEARDEGTRCRGARGRGVAMKPTEWIALALVMFTIGSWCGCSEPPLKRPPKRASACQCAEAPR